MQWWCGESTAIFCVDFVRNLFRIRKSSIPLHMGFLMSATIHSIHSCNRKKKEAKVSGKKMRGLNWIDYTLILWAWTGNTIPSLNSQTVDLKLENDFSSAVCFLRFHPSIAWKGEINCSCWFTCHMFNLKQISNWVFANTQH